VWRLKRIDDLPVWSISCLYVRKGYRKRGITSVLIDRRDIGGESGGRARHRSVSVGCKADSKRDRHRVRLDVRTRWLQDSRTSHGCSPNHAPRSEKTVSGIGIGQIETEEGDQSEPLSD
jgi:hypothetical protein